MPPSKQVACAFYPGRHLLTQVEAAELEKLKSRRFRAARVLSSVCPVASLSASGNETETGFQP